MSDELSGPSTRSIQQAEQGDPEARDRILLEVMRKANRIMGKRLPVQLDQDDLVQEVAQATHEGFAKGARFDNRRRFWGWIRSVVRNKVANQLRKQPRLLESIVVDDIETDSVSPSKIAADRELAAWAQRTLAELSAQDKRLWQMRIVDGLDFRKIAEHLSLPEETAKKRFQRLLERLSVGVRLLIQLDKLERSGVVELPPNYRQAIIWHEITGLTQQELSQRLATSTKGVSLMLARVRTALGADQGSVA